jgi:citrate synthase
MTEPLVAPPGLKNVIVADTALGEVRGAEGFYHYREYDATELACRHTFEECWFLLFEGQLPAPAELTAFRAEIAGHQQIPADVLDLLPAIARVGEERQSLQRLRTALSQLGSVGGFAPVWGASADQVRGDALRLAAVVPTLQAALFRLRRGQQPIPPEPGLSVGANWLQMITGERPSAEHERALNTYLGLTIDHGFNASTFTARVVASSGSDVASAICAAIGTFVGPLHGGAPDRALDALDDIGSPERAREWARATISSGERIMGFGHGVYTTEDPRARTLRAVARELGGPLADFAIATEAEIVAALQELKPGRSLYVNVEFYAGVVMEQIGIPRSMFTPTFACARVVGWGANVIEQARGTKIFRPLARYTGPEPARGGSAGTEAARAAAAR